MNQAERTTPAGRKPGTPQPDRRQGPGRLSRAAAAFLLVGSLAAPALGEVAALDGGGADLRSTPESQGIRLAQVRQNELAREQATILRLEEQIRRLNGRIEELEYRQRQTENRLNQVIDDQAAGAVTSENDADIGQGPVILEQTARSPEEAIRDLAERSTTSEGGLGRVPESAVARLPRPDPAAVAAPARSNLSAEEQYENAVQLLQAGNYKGAQDGLELFLDMHKDHQLASNAAYWLAETHYVRQNYAAAAAAFARNYGTYGKDSPKAIDNLLKLGMSLSNLGESDKACLSYDELRNNFPNPPAQIEQALNRERARAKCA